MAFYRCDRGLGFDTSNSTGESSDVLYDKRYDKSLTGTLNRDNIYKGYTTHLSYDCTISPTYLEAPINLYDENLIPQNIRENIEIYDIIGINHFYNPRVVKGKTFTTNNQFYLNRSAALYSKCIYHRNGFSWYANDNPFIPYKTLFINDTNYIDEFEKLIRKTSIYTYYIDINNKIKNGEFDPRIEVVPSANKNDPESYIRNKYDVTEAFDYDNYDIEWRSDRYQCVRSLNVSMEMVTLFSNTYAIISFSYLQYPQVSRIRFYNGDSYLILYNIYPQHYYGNIYNIQVIINFADDKITPIPYYGNINIIKHDQQKNTILIAIKSGAYYNNAAKSFIKIDLISGNIIVQLQDEVTNDFKLLGDYLVISKVSSSSYMNHKVQISKFNENLENVETFIINVNHTFKKYSSNYSSGEVKNTTYAINPVEIIDGYELTVVQELSTSGTIYSHKQNLCDMYETRIFSTNSNDYLRVGARYTSSDPISSYYYMNLIRELGAIFNINKQNLRIMYGYYNCRVIICELSSIVPRNNNYAYMYNIDGSLLSAPSYTTMDQYLLYINILYFLNNYNEINITNIDNTNSNYTDYYFN